jgi:hypothetical protein
MGGQAQDSAIDALLKTLDRIARDLGNGLHYSKKKPLRPTVLTHNIEDVFNNTHPKLLIYGIHQRQIPKNLTDYATTFTSERTLSFYFDDLRETSKPFKAGLSQRSPASPILFPIYANAIVNPTIPMNDHLESKCTYIDDIGMVQPTTKIDNAIFCLKTRSEIQINGGKILHIRYLQDKLGLMFCFPTGGAFKSIEVESHTDYASSTSNHIQFSCMMYNIFTIKHQVSKIPHLC